MGGPELRGEEAGEMATRKPWCVCSHCGLEMSTGDAHDLILYDRDHYIKNNKLHYCTQVRKHLYLCDKCSMDMEDLMCTIEEYVSPHNKKGR